MHECILLVALSRVAGTCKVRDNLINFYCSNNKLSSLDNGPNIVNGNFYCKNNKLTTNYSKIKVSGLFITTLEERGLKKDNYTDWVKKQKIKSIIKIKLTNYNAAANARPEVVKENNPTLPVSVRASERDYLIHLLPESRAARVRGRGRGRGRQAE